LSLLSHENAPSIISFIVPSGMPHHHRLLWALAYNPTSYVLWCCVHYFLSLVILTLLNILCHSFIHPLSSPSSSTTTPMLMDWLYLASHPLLLRLTPGQPYGMLHACMHPCILWLVPVLGN
jgi:hypothetical protein